MKENFPFCEIKGSLLFFLPVLHGRLEFAQAVNIYLPKLQPEALAIEYPSTLKEKILRGVRRLPYLSVVSYTERDGTKVYLLIEPVEPLVEAVRIGIERDLPLFFVDLDIEGYEEEKEIFPDSYALFRIGYVNYISQALKKSYNKSHLDKLREHTIAYHLQQLASKYRRIVFIGGLAHIKNIMKLLKEDLPPPLEKKKREGVRIYHLHADSSREVLSEMPFLQKEYEKARNKQKLPLDRLLIQEKLLCEVLEEYHKKNNERVSPQYLKVFRQFVRNYALLEGRLSPDLYHLLVASRGAINDDFAWEFWQIATYYPYQTNQPDLIPIRITIEDLLKSHKKFRFFRKLKSLRSRRFPLKKRPLEKEAGEWKDSWRGINICSFPPEDIVVETFGRQVMKKALRILAENLRSTGPFLVSMKDGIDIRETLRHWYEKRIYVKEERPASGKVGSVVVIFDADEDPLHERYPWKLTWHGEHNQESDMAFYATPAGKVIIGPGISKCHYGGFMLTYPPMRVLDIWKDPVFDFARNKPERLLLAAVDYSLEKYILYIAKTPPSYLAKSFASAQGKKILYLPLGHFSSVLLKKIQTFHVLEGHHVRDYAHKYIEGE